MTTLVLIACIIGAPEQCKTYSVPVEAGLMCHLRQGAIAQWQAEHTDRNVVRWWCE